MSDQRITYLNRPVTACFVLENNSSSTVGFPRFFKFTHTKPLGGFGSGKKYKRLLLNFGFIDVDRRFATYDDNKALRSYFFSFQKIDSINIQGRCLSISLLPYSIFTDTTNDFRHHEIAALVNYGHDGNQPTSVSDVTSTLKVDLLIFSIFEFWNKN